MNKTILYASARSPFARRIRLALHRLEVPYEEVILDVFKRNEELFQANPLGLVPTLVADGMSISDSATILEYLHDKTGKIWPSSFEQKIKTRQASTWCEGIMQYTVNYFLETAHHEVPSKEWAQEYQDNILETLKAMEKLPESTWISNSALTQAGWDRGVALQYLEFRIPQIAAAEKNLKSILNQCLEDQFFRDTIPRA